MRDTPSLDDQPSIGEWRFDIDSAALLQPGRTKRLEDRAARTLALLFQRRGEVVSKAQILEEVWKGRTVSDNSVAIVIADLRRALGENSRAPQHIETVGKRGYRLRVAADAVSLPEPSTDHPEPSSQSARGRGTLAAGAALVFVFVILVAIGMFATSRTPPVLLLLDPVRNETGEPRYAPLTTALAALIQERAARMPGLVATDVGVGRVEVRGARRLEMRSRLIIWNDTPTLSLAAVDPSNGKIFWSGMAVGQPNMIADAAIRQMADFQHHLSR
jgi:DNA-binding winged helix-turn-helix (wHTH) protein